MLTVKWRQKELPYSVSICSGILVFFRAGFRPRFCYSQALPVLFVLASAERRPKSFDFGAPREYLIDLFRSLGRFHVTFCIACSLCGDGVCRYRNGSTSRYCDPGTAPWNGAASHLGGNPL